MNSLSWDDRHEFPVDKLEYLSKASSGEVDIVDSIFANLAVCPVGKINCVRNMIPHETVEMADNLINVEWATFGVIAIPPRHKAI